MFSRKTNKVDKYGPSIFERAFKTWRIVDLLKRLFQKYY